MYNHDDPESPVEKKSEGIGIAPRGDAMTDGKETEADWCVAFAMVNELDNDGDGDNERDDGDEVRGEKRVREQASQERNSIGHLQKSPHVPIGKLYAVWRLV